MVYSKIKKTKNLIVIVDNDFLMPYAKLTKKRRHVFSKGMCSAFFKIISLFFYENQTNQTFEFVEFP